MGVCRIVEVCVGVCRCVWSVGHAHSTVSITNAMDAMVFRWTSMRVYASTHGWNPRTLWGDRDGTAGCLSGVVFCRRASMRRDDDENMGDDRRRRDDRRVRGACVRVRCDA